jgi:hypothetical protein
LDQAQVWREVGAAFQAAGSEDQQRVKREGAGSAPAKQVFRRS